MNVHYSDELKQAFVVRPDHLKKLVELLQKHIGKVYISTDCVDKIKRDFETVEDLIGYENPKSKRISRLHLRARSNDDSKSATIVFRAPLWFQEPVSIDVIGREDVVSILKEQVLDVLSGMCPWYSRIASADLLTIIGVGCWILLFISSIAVLFEWIPVADSPSSDSKNVKGEAFAIVFCLITLLAIWSFYQLRGFLFPKLVFTIGQGESRFRLLEKVRWGVVITFFVSLAATLVGSIIVVFF